MPGTLVHLGATVMCSHAGQALPTVTNPRVLVGGMPVLLLDSQAICAPTGTPTIIAVTQTRVMGS